MLAVAVIERKISKTQVYFSGARYNYVLTLNLFFYMFKVCPTSVHCEMCTCDNYLQNEPVELR